MGVSVSPIALYPSHAKFDSCSHKPIVRGLSSLYSTMKHGSCAMSSCSGGIEVLSSIRFDRCYYSHLSVSKGVVSIGSWNGGVFNGVVRHGLGSCLEYDVGQFVDSSGIGVDELAFKVAYGSHELCFEYLLMDAQSRHKIFYDGFVIKAFREAEVAHRGQMRLSGDPYLKHCVETAMYLAVIGANSTVVAAGLLHDTFDDSFITHDYIARIFGNGVADLVKGVSKLSLLSKLAREYNTANKTIEADRLHTMFLAMADARAVLIKLADRLHNMMTLDALPNQKRERFAKETLEIFVPLANRLGLTTWKEQLETLCFKYVYPKEHEELALKLVTTFDEALISSTISKLESALKVADISYQDLSGRHKSLLSIHRKMLKKNLNMDEIHDIHGIRLIVGKEKDCYNALEVIHNLWHAIPGRFKDYITRPKFNGYQSLHTVVMGDCMVHIEVQIRTMEMHVQAEFGFAAHWRYKEGDCTYSPFVLQMVEWARRVVTWQCQTMSKDQSLISCFDSKQPCKFPSHSQDSAYSCKPHCGSDGPVIVIVIENDKMSVQEFPANSTVMNLLERFHGRSRWTPCGFPAKEELRPRVNHVPVSGPTSKLKIGDVVELSPPLPDKSLTEYREEIQRMYDRGLTISNVIMPTSGSGIHL